MPRSKYTKRRRIIQSVCLLLLLSVPLRLVCFDLDGECLRIFGKEFGLATMFYPLFSIVGLLLFVVYLSMKKGRIFCSHMCPMHMFLETVNSPGNRHSPKRRAKVWMWSVAWSLFLTEVILSFFQPLDNQIKLIVSGHLPIIGISSALMGGFMGLFIHYQEHFCKKGCPYALIQLLLQSDRTRAMEFSNPEKTCTNCNLCAEACTDELGEGNTLFHLLDPEPTGGRL